MCILASNPISEIFIMRSIMFLFPSRIFLPLSVGFSRGSKSLLKTDQFETVKAVSTRADSMY